MGLAVQDLLHVSNGLIAARIASMAFTILAGPFLGMVSPQGQKTGQLVCYLTRTTRVLTTQLRKHLDMTVLII
jgi:hypothetical protein